jgi:N,N'-diacetylchitobiose transport system permease protein
VNYVLRRRVVSVLLSALAVLIFVASVFPVYWMVNTSFQPNNEIRASQLHFWPDNFTLRNYATVLLDPGRTPFLPAAANSLMVTIFTVAVALVFAFLASLAVTRFNFRSRKGFILAILIVQMIPAEAMIVSTYRVLDGWNLLNTIAGLTFVYVATVLPFTIWTLRGFVNGVPADLEEAGMIDGLSRTGAFWRITFPLLAPGLVATGVFGFIQAWN